MYPELIYRRLQAGPNRYRYQPDAEWTLARRFYAGLGATLFSTVLIAGAALALGAVIVEPLSRLAWVA